MTLFVTERGSDGNTGTSPEQALRTVATAAQRLTPGSTIYVGRGTYPGRVSITNVAGTAALPVRLIADREGTMTRTPDGEVTLDADGDAIGVIVTNSTHVLIDGFFLRGAGPSETVAAGVGIRIRTNSDDTTVRNCVIVNAEAADGIRIDSSDDVLVFNNLIFAADRGIVVTGAANDTAIVNNTIALSSRAGISVREANAVRPRNTRIQNTIVQETGNGIGIDLTGNNGPFVSNHNLVFQPDSEDPLGPYRPPDARGANDVNADARFVNLDVGDVHLAADSPAINAGTDTIARALEDMLEARSTTPDGERDRLPLDMGYHYPR